MEPAFCYIDLHLQLYSYAHKAAPVEQLGNVYKNLRQEARLAAKLNLKLTHSSMPTLTLLFADYWHHNH
jgi:hypothetical protein